MIVSKLSTYRRQNRTKKALWEFDNIIKSLHLLDYVDSFDNDLMSTNMAELTAQLVGPDAKLWQNSA